MAKRSQFKVSLPDDLHDALWHERIHSGASNTRFTAATFLVWMMSDDQAKQRALSMASMLDEGDISWDVASKWSTATKKDRDKIFSETVALATLRQNVKHSLGLKRKPGSPPKGK